MFIADRRIALIYRLLTIGLIFTGLGRVSDLFEGNFSPKIFLLYTGLSNLLGLIWVIILVVVTIRDLRKDGVRGASTPSPRCGAAMMWAVSVTMLIYLVVLVPSADSSSDYVPFGLTDNLIHIITPCLLIAEWFLFAPKRKLRWIDPLLWVLIPLAYMTFAYIWSAGGGVFGDNDDTYPYPFMDIGALGFGGVAQWILTLVGALTVVGYIYVVCDRLLAAAGKVIAARRALR